jgi:PTS system nitrogen regulatory IIA component|tara:strand:- start:97 stop:549 length:453 start_codon:yes stop_codon:yes gene_type:complete
MTIEKMITKHSVLLDLEVKNKKQLLEDLSKNIASIIEEEEREIFNILLEREKLGTTGIGRGVAVPHGKLPKLEKIHLLFARTKKPIEYDSEDKQSVDLFFLLLAPEESGADHLQALSEISKIARNREMRKALRAAKDIEEIIKIFQSADL